LIIHHEDIDLVVFIHGGSDQGTQVTCGKKFPLITPL
jgi:hypothetical protein